MLTHHPSIGFHVVESQELRQVQGGAIPIIGRIVVWGASKAIVWGIDKIRGRDGKAH